jgi:hypothetical protein
MNKSTYPTNIYTPESNLKKGLLYYIGVRNHVLDYDPNEDQNYMKRHKKCHKWRR